MERDLIAERVRNGLANAKAKGIRIGRLKTRDSDLIRKLRASGMTFRNIAKIARCSSGAVAAEMRAMKAEAKIAALAEELIPKLELEKPNSSQIIISGRANRSQDFDFDGQGSRFELER